MSNHTGEPGADGGGWDRLGFEVELLAPPGSNRSTLAVALAEKFGGSVRIVFHHDTEPSLVKGRPVFHHLTRGFEVLDGSGSVRCRLVDDVTIQTDLDPEARPSPGWYRIVSDEARLLRLIEQLTDPSSDATEVLKPVAAAFGVVVQPLDGGKVRLDDAAGATVAIVAPQGGERERVCEVITPPLCVDHEAALAELLVPARELGFTVPAEAAVHVHLDAAPFRSSAALARLVLTFATDREGLWQALETNPLCRRLGPLPEELVSGVGEPGFCSRPWNETADWLATLPMTKFSDCNLMNLRAAAPAVDTVELRVLPGAIDARGIMDGVSKLRQRYQQQP